MSGDLKENIVPFYRSGLGYKKISERIHISVNTIAKIVQKFKSTSVVRAKPRSGRLPQLTERDVRHIEQCVRKDRRRSASLLAHEVFSFSGETVSAQTVH